VLHTGTLATAQAACHPQINGTVKPRFTQRPVPARTLPNHPLLSSGSKTV
jgi:hypothetical protein